MLLLIAERSLAMMTTIELIKKKKREQKKRNGINFWNHIGKPVTDRCWFWDRDKASHSGTSVHIMKIIK